MNFIGKIKKHYDTYGMTGLTEDALNKKLGFGTKVRIENTTYVGNLVREKNNTSPNFALLVFSDEHIKVISLEDRIRRKPFSRTLEADRRPSADDVLIRAYEIPSKFYQSLDSIRQVR